MKRLIDADAFKKENERLLHCDFPHLSETTLEELIDEAPTIDAIPIEWIEAQIEWLKSLDNAFSTLTAGQISAMVNRWKDEQDG